MVHKKETKRSKKTGRRVLNTMIDTGTFAAIEAQAKTEERLVSAMARVILKRWAEQREEAAR